MKVIKKMTAILVTFVFAVCLAMFIFAAPVPVTVADRVNDGSLSGDVVFLLTENGVGIELGQKADASNVRFVEIDGVQTEITSDDIYNVVVGDKNLLVEITEKADRNSASVVKTQYYYINAEDKSVMRLNMDSYIDTYNETTVRVRTSAGLRFKSRISTSVKEATETFVIEEYGYLVADTEKLGTDELNFDYSKYVKGVGYSREKGIDIIYDSSNDYFDVFTGVFKNIPVKYYDRNVTCKTYTKIAVGDDVFTVYGEPVTDSVFNSAKKLFACDTANNAASQIVFDYVHYINPQNSSYTNTLINKTTANKVRGKFTNTDSIGKEYFVYLVGYDSYGKVSLVEKSSAFTVQSGFNTFTHSFTGDYSGLFAKAFVFTSDMEFICQEDIDYNFLIDWTPADSDFYSVISDSKYGYGTDFEGSFDDDGVTVIDAVTAVANLHAKYNKNEIIDADSSEYEHILDMDDASVIVDLSDRNSINTDGINFTYAEGGIDEEGGYLYGTSVKKETGGYDPQVVINGLNLDSRNYDKITIRIKYATVPGYYINLRNQTLQIFFKTNTDSALSESKSVRLDFKSSGIPSLTNWFEVEFDLSSKENWKDIITGIRVDPLNNNGKFYIDYVKFSKSENDTESDWYDVFLDYAYENNLLKLGKFKESEFTRNITRKEFLNMLFKVYPESFFEPVNNVMGIPDVDKNTKNSEVYLMLYNAGITLGFDEEGNLGLDEEISKSEVAAIINRLLVKENRLKGNVDSNWDDQGTELDFEFNNPSDIDLFKFVRANIISNTGGHLRLKSDYDSYMTYNNTVSVDAKKYTKFRIRVKAEYNTPPTNNILEVFFIPKGVSGYSTANSVTITASDFYLDELGWYIFEIDLRLHPQWKGTITNLRFDLINDAGTYTLDYIRFVENPDYGIPEDHDGLVAAGYTATKLMPDGFENGFVVSRVDQSVKWPEIHGLFNDYCTAVNPDYDPEVDKPVWTIGPWWQGTGEGFTEIDLFENRDTTTGIYTLADTYGINTITYNPVEKSITQRLNATKIYNGKPHDIDTYKWWPHQLLDTNENYVATVDKQKNSADADKMFVELDIKMTDFKNTTNPEGRNVCSYLAYFYLRPKDNPSHRIWFGLNLFSTASDTSNPEGLNASKNVVPNWAPDSAAHQYMYGMPMAVVYDGIENSFNPSKGVAAVSDEWKHIRLDVTPHIERVLEWANRDNIFGMEVTKEDMFFNGVNIGYEIHGNYDCTFEIKNFNMIAYNLD